MSRAHSLKLSYLRRGCSVEFTCEVVDGREVDVRYRWRRVEFDGDVCMCKHCCASPGNQQLSNKGPAGRFNGRVGG